MEQTREIAQKGMAVANAVEMRGITKRYGALTATDGVDLAVAKGEIHAVVGENGAGKSTLMHVLSGLVRPEEGVVRVNGAPLRLGEPSSAADAGVGLVAQHFSLVGPFTAWENVVLGREPGGWARVDRAGAVEATDALARKLGIRFSPDAPVGDLPVGMRQTIEIVKALYRGAEILVLDEPTATLSPPEANRFFSVIHRLRRTGTTILLVTHRVREVLDHAARATVLREGRVVRTFARAEIDAEMLVRAVMGGEREGRGGTEDRRGAGAPLLELEGLRVSPEGHAQLEGLDLTVRRGEILGVAGVSGNGQRALTGAITGTLPVESGAIRLAGTEITGVSVRARREAGLAYIPEDRHDEGIIPDFTVRDNLILGRQGAFARVWGLDVSAMEAYARRLAERFDIRAQSLLQPARHLSGGNQQKLVVARELGRDPLFVLAADPTRGLDFRSSAFVLRELRSVRARGGGVLVFSSDLEAPFSVSDRIVVIYRGRIVGVRCREAFDASTLGRWMTGAN